MKVDLPLRLAIVLVIGIALARLSKTVPTFGFKFSDLVKVLVDEMEATS